MKKAAYHNLGCKVNSYELESVIKLLQEDGYEIVEFNDEADIYIVNTCSVTNIADRKSRQMINRARKKSPEAVVVAMGCFVQGLTEEDRAKVNADIIIGNNRKMNILEDIHEYLSNRGEHLIDCNDINDGNVGYEELRLEQTPSHTRAFIKVQDGCNQFCSYCIIPYTRGRVRSRNYEEVVREISILASKGCKEFVLTGIHLSSYCQEVEGGEFRLIDLIECIDSINGVERIRLGSLEPTIITREFLDRLINVRSFCPHFHLSLQSGCDDVLSRMNRKYTTEQYYNSCVLLREYYNEPAITTDVIVGFPGETEGEFSETYDFLKKVHFYEMHVFKYSRRKGTRADRMDNQIPEEVKTARSAKLLDLDSDMSTEYRARLIGQELEALMEEKVVIGDMKYYQGYTREYVRVLCPDNGNDMSNQLIIGTGREVINDSIIIEL